MTDIKRQPVKIERQKASIVRKSGRIVRTPRIETMFEDTDPLGDVEYNPGDLEESASAEMSEILKQLIERRKANRDAFRITRDTEYWVSLVFQSKEQKDEFLTRSGWGAAGTRYLNGLDTCRRVGVDIQPVEIKLLPLRGKPSKYKNGKEVI